jgi:hypothetical protein
MYIGSTTKNLYTQNRLGAQAKCAPVIRPPHRNLQANLQANLPIIPHQPAPYEGQKQARSIKCGNQQNGQ